MNVKNQLKIGSLEFKITADKLYIETVDGSETYALRSINGISVKDDIGKYNGELNALKGQKQIGTALLIFGLVILMLCLWLGWPIVRLIFGGCFIVPGIISMNSGAKPRLESIVRITMNSGDKAFRFFKDDANSGEVADFVATLESTLTAFHKE